MNIFLNFRDARLMGTPSHPGWWTRGRCCWDDSFVLARVILWWIKLTWLTAINHLLASDIQTGENQLCQFKIWPHILPALKYFHLSKLLTSPQLRFLQNWHLLDWQICRMSLRWAQKVVITRTAMSHQTGILGKYPRDQVVFWCPPKGMVGTKISKLFSKREEM